MTDVSTTRRTLQEAYRWRDVLWDSILEDLNRRDPAAARDVRDALSQQPLLMYQSRSTRYAAWAWSYLDTQARQEWIWVCEFVQHMWIRGLLDQLKAKDRAVL